MESAQCKCTQSSSSVSFPFSHFGTLASSCWFWSLSSHSRGNLRHIVQIAPWIVHLLLPYCKNPGQGTVAEIIANPESAPVPGTPLLTNYRAKMQNCNTTPKPLMSCTCTDTIWPSVILCPTQHEQNKQSVSWSVIDGCVETMIGQEENETSFGLNCSTG